MSHKGDVVDDDDAHSIASDASYEELERGDCAKRFRGFLLRLAISLIVIGACTGALIWSFENGEAGANPEYVRDTSKNFSIQVNEYSEKDGTYSVVMRKPDNGNNNTLQTPQTYPSFWYQDDDNQRLVHRRDNQTTLFVYSNFAYWATYNKHGDVVKCRYDRRMNYMRYITNLGLSNLVREHSAYESTHHHAKVFIYQGDPTDVIIEGTPQQAFLVSAYSDASTGALLGWDTYFTSSNSSLVYEISYWYDTMVQKTPDASLFDAPAECEPS